MRNILLVLGALAAPYAMVLPAAWSPEMPIEHRSVSVNGRAYDVQLYRGDRVRIGRSLAKVGEEDGQLVSRVTIAAAGRVATTTRPATTEEAAVYDAVF